VRLTGEGGSTVQVLAERADGTLTIDDCVEITRVISPVLDVEDPMPGRYRLEVSSPGIDRPLVRPIDFERHAGFEARIELATPVDGQRRFRGHIEGFADGEVRLETEVKGFDEPQIVGLRFDDIHEAKLVMTDELLKASAERRPERLN
jgi:ribosome maturation factor RimP